MTHRLLLTATGAFFLSDSVIFMACGVGMGDWRAVVVGVVEAIGAVTLVVLGVN